MLSESDGGEMAIKFAHTNLIARDWKRLAAFYQEVFNCQSIQPERDMSGEWLDKATGLTEAHLTCVFRATATRGQLSKSFNIVLCPSTLR